MPRRPEYFRKNIEQLRSSFFETNWLNIADRGYGHFYASLEFLSQKRHGKLDIKLGRGQRIFVQVENDFWKNKKCEKNIKLFKKRVFLFRSRTIFRKIKKKKKNIAIFIKRVFCLGLERFFRKKITLPKAINYRDYMWINITNQKKLVSSKNSDVWPSNELK